MPHTNTGATAGASTGTAPETAIAETAIPQVTIHTDGACIGNPGPGGYGIILDYGGRRRELSAGYARTTNNRMELLAAIIGLETLSRPCRVTLYSDSRYLVDAVTKGWAQKWRRNGWMRTPRQPALNPDLWQRLLDSCARHHAVDFRWVRGHSGHPDNERCDRLASAAARQPGLPPDPGYPDAPGPRRRMRGMK